MMSLSATPRVIPVSEAAATRELPPSPFSHSFYRDRLYGSADAADLLVVMSRSDLRDDRPDWPFATLVLAPRNRLSVALDERIAAAGADRHTVVVLLTLDSQPRWIAAGRRLRSSEALIRAADAGPVRVDAARITASLLGFGVADPELEALLQADRAALRLEAPDLASAQQALQELAALLPASALDGGIAFLPVGGRSTVAIVSESTVTWVTALAAIAVAFVLVAYPQAMHAAWRATRSEAGRIAVMFAALIATLMIANLALRGLFATVGPQLPAASMFVAKIALGVVVLGALFHFVHLRYAGRQSYALAAAILFGAAAVVAAIVHISLSLVFLVSMACAIGFGISRRVWIAGSWFVAALLPITYLAITLGLRPEPSLAAAVLTPALWREVLTALFVLPLLLLFFRIDSLTPRLPLAGALSVAALAFIAVFVAQAIVTLGEPNPLHVRIVERHPSDGIGDASVIIERISGGPARDVQIENDRLGTIFCDRLPCARAIPAQPAPFTVATDPTQALDRYRLGVVLQFASSADALDVRLVSRQAYTVLTSSIPLRGGIATARQVVELDPGPEPPDTVTFELRLDSVPSELRLELRAEYLIALEAEAVDDGGSDPIVAEHRVSFGTMVGPEQLLP